MKKTFNNSVLMKFSEDYSKNKFTQHRFNKNFFLQFEVCVLSGGNPVI